MKDTTRAMWLTRIEEWRRSGKTAEEFAEGQPFSGGTLTWRASQLRHELSPRRKARATHGGPGVGSRVVFAQVVRRKPLTTAPGAGLTVEVGSARISVSAGFDGALLRDVVRALREAGS
jgi:hypothetical protein